MDGNKAHRTNHKSQERRNSYYEPGCTRYKFGNHKTLGMPVADALTVAGAWYNSFSSINTRTKAISHQGFKETLVKEAMERSVSRMFKTREMISNCTGDFIGGTSKHVHDAVHNQTSVLKNIGWDVEACFFMWGESCLVELMNLLYDTRGRLKIRQKSYELPPEIEDEDLVGMIISGTDILLVTENKHKTLRVLSNNGWYDVQELQSERDLAINERLSLSRDAKEAFRAKDSAHYFRKNLLAITLENHTTEAALHMLVVVSGIILLENSSTEYYKRQEKVIELVFADLRRARHLQRLIETQTKTDQAISVVLSRAEIKKYLREGTALERGRLMTVSDLPQETECSPGPNSVLTPEYRKADKLFSQFMEKSIDCRDPKIGLFRKEEDLDYIRFSNLQTTKEELQSTSGLDAVLKRRKVNIFEGKRSKLFYLPFKESAIYTSFDVRIADCKEWTKRRQRFTNEQVMPFVLPAVLLSSLDIIKREEISERIKKALNGSHSIMDLEELTLAYIMSEIKTRANNSNGLRMSNLLTGPVFLALTIEEKAWIHREIIHMLVDEGAFNRGTEVNVSSYFDVAKELFQLKKSKLPITIDIMTPLRGLNVLLFEGRAQLVGNGADGRVAVVERPDGSPLTRETLATVKVVYMKTDMEEGEFEDGFEVVPYHATFTITKAAGKG